MHHLSLVNPGLHLTVARIGKDFAGKAVLNNLQLTIPGGQFVAIVGRSGCGKSTLLRLLAGLDSATRGEIQADDQPLSQHDSDIRMMFQDARLLPWKTVIGNVGLGLKGPWRARALEVLTAVGLAEKADSWPSTLSGGQKQRVALARALIHRPRLLLLDEPFGALDALTRLEMQQLLTRLWQQFGFTVVLVTHDVHEAVFLADRVLMIHQGETGLDLAVNIARPRHLATPALANLEATVLETIMTPDAPRETSATEKQIAAR
ncbi:ATP-binding cassette domain-containing protein [Shimwellia blattae]|uniref:Aliphatic sulfonates import ATP-binding protein n=1 Tax=Shimwellia blattae (strain ATCC 29907 / DSM 4481 / JCM 1650 / NBRC 105725 / CDC 9005-74) TaxID=630626 RepID=I2BBX0_SHIBC|nr:ATP-binding cassette domain-containing protein [Shimwellia blattae]AFJ48024.1 aliphatic sulfonates import ATP-binding protein [Shimwellia blattae DSM 4481 = NBRC 105725]GAB81987.1 aliphatic sulfonate ABC transporter ATP-binding protein [Shimwellia blattae DSM 4481 = NBRC 105725]VDY65523.1 Aliphatic sulfonates import ATP-binding protein SsuB [Shimwellia blattae]VEC24844.1 Aliphatic sulfonates import ATP-binding protein SsuB [Shimwellia blattae]